MFMIYVYKCIFSNTPEPPNIKRNGTRREAHGLSRGDLDWFGSLKGYERLCS